MHILLFGKTGQVGWELQRALAPLGKITALSTRSTEWCGDLTQPEEIRKSIQNLRPDIIVNAAAYTAVDKAESEPDLAELINSTSVKVMAEEAKNLNAILIHYSTDYVYSGEGHNRWRESDKPEPRNVYGKTKLSGEQAITAADIQYLIFRTSWVYASRSNNFIKTMLRLGSEKEALSIINDQIGAPTGAALIADITAHALRMIQANPELRGIYNLAAAGETSWFDYASLIFTESEKYSTGLKIKKLSPIKTAEYITPAKRPLNSRLDLTKIERSFNLTLPHWQNGVRYAINEILA
ncbi:dTDP-4-dehydrorhamnose reductase [Pantoea eucrina]|uniref:dTDP-4-dehydrorhamnose reductase n=1 Tax=Pantoea eucrina TaxID=472693 RepID=UPI000A2390FE|nr:dTDP-4-dehydrorhamnose reductase [Pantoea eucrina]ORM77329.1 dTDP-4-dehydrorhamnose reductase [Pantoea eucrina]